MLYPNDAGHKNQAKGRSDSHRDVTGRGRRLGLAEEVGFEPTAFRKPGLNRKDLRRHRFLFVRVLSELRFALAARISVTLFFFGCPARYSRCRRRASRLSSELVMS